MTRFPRRLLQLGVFRLGFLQDGDVGVGVFPAAADGTFTFFDVPAAGTSNGQGAFPMTNNPGSAIVGYYIDSKGAYHGFVRQ